MPDISSWPPPPTVPAAPVPHDAFLTACVLNSLDKKPVSRRSLASELCKQDGDWRQSFAVVDDYCDRQQILPPPSGFAAWGATLFALANCAITVIFIAIQLSLQRSHDTAVTRIARVAITQERLNLDLTLLGFTVIFCCIITFLAVRNIKMQHRNARLARQKLMAQANTQI